MIFCHSAEVGISYEVGYHLSEAKTIALDFELELELYLTTRNTKKAQSTQRFF